MNDEKKYATRDLVRTRRPQPVEHEVDGIVYLLRAMSGADLDSYEMECIQIDGAQVRFTARGISRAGLVARCLVDVNGDRLYSDSPEDIAELGAMDTKTLQSLYDRAQDLCGGSTEAQAKIAKNSDAAEPAALFIG